MAKRPSKTKVKTSALQHSSAVQKTAAPAPIKFTMPKAAIVQIPHDAGWLECVCHVHGELARCGVDAHRHRFYEREKLLIGAQYCVLRQLRERFDEMPFSLLHHPLILRMANLESRMQAHLCPKPRINLTVELTRPGNLIVSWKATGDTEDHDGCDFVLLNSSDRWVLPNTSIQLLRVDFFSQLARPENMHEIPKTDFGKSITLAIAQTVIALVGELKSRLSLSFNVTVTDDIYAKWDIADEYGPLPGARLVGWEVEDCKTWQKRSDLAILDGFEKRCGLPLAKLIDAMALAASKRQGGPTTCATYISAKVASKLRPLGHPINTAKVAEMLELLRRSRPQDLPDGLKIVPPVVATKVNLVGPAQPVRRVV